MKNKQKLFLFFSIFLMCAVFFYIFFLKEKQDLNKVPFLRVEKKALFFSISTTGKINSDGILYVKSELTGKINDIFFHVGDSFKKGDILVSFEQETENQEIKQAQVQLDKAKNNLEQIQTSQALEAKELFNQAQLSYELDKSDYEKKILLYEAGAISLESLDDSKYKMDLSLSKLNIAREKLYALSPQGVLYKDALTQMKSAEINLSSSQLKKQKTQILAPFNGTVLEKYAEIGELMSLNKDLMLIAKDSPLYVEATIDEKFLPQLSLNQPVYIKPEAEAFSNKIIEGKVTFIAPNINEQNGTVEIKVSMDTIPSYLKINQTVKLEIITGQEENAIAVDKQYIIDSSNPSALTLENGIVVNRNLSIKRDLGDKYLIDQGLKENDILLLPGSVKPGKKFSLSPSER